MLRTYRSLLPWLVRNEEGATYLEYLLLVMFIAIVCVAAVTAFGAALASMYSDIVKHLP